MPLDPAALHVPQGAIDCDVHPTLPGMAALMPYLDVYWRDAFAMRGIDRMDLTMSGEPPHTPFRARADWRRPGGGGARDVAGLQRDLLDSFRLRLAILNCIHPGLAVFSEDMAAVMCRAVNDWLAAEWLDRDDRLRAAITVPLQGPALAVEEIARRAGDPRFVAVLVLVSNDLPLGRRHHWPIWREAARHGLPVIVHAGSTYRQAPTSTGWPSFLVEDLVAEAQAFEGALLSLLAEGVFEEIPGLNIVLAESGAGWLPGFLWRANKTWRGVRAEVPWLRRPPAEVLRRQLRVTTQPFDLPTGEDAMARFLAQLSAEEMLLFSTDYPHWQFDGMAALPAGLPESVLARNALACFPRLRENAGRAGDAA